MSDKQQDDALMDAYRRASASDADRPSGTTRTAILAEAAAAARRNSPAANQPRYWMRAVAGIAVVGIGVVLWRQTDYRTAPDAPVLTSIPAEQVERAGLPESTVESAREPVEENVVKADHRAADAVRAPASPQPFPVSPPPAPPSVEDPRVAVTTAAPPPVTGPPSAPQIARNSPEDDELSEIMITGTRIQIPKSERDEVASLINAPRAGGGAPRGPAPGGGIGGGAPLAQDNTALLRQHFPSQYQSDASHSLWLVLSAAGEVLQSGELAPGQSLADLAPRIARAIGDREPGPWRVQTLRNARGQLIELAIARLP